MQRFHRPVRLPIEAFDVVVGAGDPATANRVAHDTAHALLNRVHESGDAELVDRTVNYANNNGLDDLVQLWAGASPLTLPGALWRLYLVHAAVIDDPTTASYLYRRGVEVDRSINHIVAGAVEPTGPDEIRSLIERILAGAFTGDFADALDRAGAFCAVMSQGAAAVAGSDERVNPERASAATRRSARYLGIARELTSAAQLWRAGKLD